MNIAQSFKISNWAERTNPLSIFSNTQEEPSKPGLKKYWPTPSFSHESLIFLIPEVSCSLLRFQTLLAMLHGSELLSGSPSAHFSQGEDSLSESFCNDRSIKFFMFGSNMWSYLLDRVFLWEKSEFFIRADPCWRTLILITCIRQKKWKNKPFTKK